MTRRLTYEYVKSKIEKESGFKLLSNEYKNSKTKIKLQCDKGHVYLVSFNSFQQGIRCPYCNGNTKHTYSHVKSKIETGTGYKLLSESYKNNSTKLKIQCDKGHVYYPSFKN